MAPPDGLFHIKKSLPTPFAGAGRPLTFSADKKILQEFYILRSRAFLALRDVETHTLALG
jgi:hypothetical protein